MATFALSMILLGACGESVDPVLGTDRAFTVYGFLDPASDRQAIRVFPIEDLLFVAEPRRIDATVSSRDVALGTVHTWRDSVVAFVPDGSLYAPDTTWGSVYSSAFRPDFGSTHEIVVRRSDGAETSVTVTLPVQAEVQVAAPSGVRGNMILPIHYGRAARILKTVVFYTIGTDGSDRTWTIGVTYEAPESVSAGGIDLVVRLSGDLGRLYERSGLRPGVDDIYLLGLSVESFVAEAAWSPPNGEFDPETLVEPGTFSNVRNGFGFVGSGYTDRTDWVVDQDAAELAGFDIPEDS